MHGGAAVGAAASQQEPFLCVIPTQAFLSLHVLCACIGSLWVL